MRKMKRVEDSRTENTYLIMNKHINSYGRLFGGVLMQWIDEMACRDNRDDCMCGQPEFQSRCLSGKYRCSDRKDDLCRQNFYGSPN